VKKLILFATLAFATLSLGKGYQQPWTPKFPAWESVVYSCDYPKPYKLIAADDFIFNFGILLPINHINWWGVVSKADQLKRPFYIAIYKDTGFCVPAWQSIIWKECVKPESVELVGEDCQGNKVWKFNSNVDPLNPLTLGDGHYWIQISEDDVDSVNPDQTDFWWSSHYPVVKCPALQADSSYNIFQPLIDPCYQKPDDLAFELLN